VDFQIFFKNIFIYVSKMT